MAGGKPTQTTRLLLLGVLWAVPSLAQDAPAWRILRDLRIDAIKEDLSPIGFVAVSPNGTIIINQTQDSLLRFFDAQGKSLGTFGRGGAGPGEFRLPATYGWIHDTLWVNDPVVRRVTFISPERKLLRSVMSLSAIRVPGAGADTTTAAPWIFPRALFGDGTALIIPIMAMGSRVPPWRGAVAAERGQIIRVRHDGTFLNVFATLPGNSCSVTYTFGRDGRGSIGTPYCGSPRDHLSAETNRYASAVVLEQTPQRSRYQVTVIRPTGDTAFSRTFERPGRAIPRRTADSTLAAFRRRATRPQEDAAYDRVTMPSGYPPYANILSGRDSTTWIEEFVPIHERRQRRWLVLDEQGAPIGRVTVPAAVQIMVASRSAIWAIETDDDGLAHIVRYRVSR